MGLPHIKPFDSKGKNFAAQILSKSGFSTVFMLFAPYLENLHSFSEVLANFSALHTNCGKGCEEARHQHPKWLISKEIVLLASILGTLAHGPMASTVTERPSAFIPTAEQPVPFVVVKFLTLFVDKSVSKGLGFRKDR
jgi:hypothetical protein